MDIRKAVRLAIENILKEGLTDVDIFLYPFELDYLKIEEVKQKIVDTVEEQILSKKFDALKINKIGSVLVPKKEFFDFRKCALIDPIDEIKYLTLVLIMAKEIEEKRINKSKNKIFSYRFMPQSGYLFDPEYNYTKFRTYVSEKSKKKNIKVVVECDISNFYDRLNLHRLESNLLAIPKISPDYVTILNELLLFWSNRDSYGLPVGSNASRILAEAALLEVDNYLVSQKIDFCRFVDDYRIFAKDAITAHHYLSLLIERLSKEGLFLNINKTKVKDVSMQFHIENNGNLEEKEVAVSLENEDIPKVKISEEELKNKFSISKIIRGYSGLIPTKFRELTNSEKEKFSKENENELIENLKEQILIEPKEIIKLIKVIVAKNVFHLTKEIPNILEKFPQFLPYITDVLLKYQNMISDDVCNSIKYDLSQWFEKENVPEYILVNLTRFFKGGKFEDKDTLLKYFRNLKRNAGDYIGRALLEALENKINRGEMLEIKDYYIRADLWEKRQILKMAGKILSKGEKRPFFKDVSIHSTDLLTEFIISEKGKFIKLLKK